MSDLSSLTQSRKAQTMGLFLTPVWKIQWDLETTRPAWEAEVYTLMQEDPEGVTKSNRNGWHSQSGIFERDAFTNLKALISTEVHRINPEVEVTGGWINVNPPGAKNAPHIHAESILSGVFYLQVPENSGAIIFSDPRPVARMMGGLPMYVTQSVEVAPRQDMLLLFPSWLTHEVAENSSQEERISIAFNTVRRPI